MFLPIQYALITLAIVAFSLWLISCFLSIKDVSTIYIKMARVSPKKFRDWIEDALKSELRQTQRAFCKRWFNRCMLLMILLASIGIFIEIIRSYF